MENAIAISFWICVIIISVFIHKKNEKNKELEKLPYKERYTREERIRRIKNKKKQKKIWKFLKPKIIILLKVIGWLLLFVVISLFAPYENKIDVWLVFAVYIFTIINHYNLSKNYKDWEEQAEYNEFYKRFCNVWKPWNIQAANLIMFFICLKLFDTVGFVICVLIPYLYDIWGRRFITTDIKQNLILEKLNK